MKKICVFIFATVYFISGFAQIDPIPTTDVLAYNFTIEVNDRNDSIIGTTTITGKGTGYNNHLVLNLKNQDRTKKGMTVSSVTELNGKPLAYSQSNDVIDINLNYKQNLYNYTLLIKYSGVPTNGLIIGQNKFGNRTWFGDNWPNRAQYWLPCIDNIADKASVAWNVIAPSQYQVVANGLLQSKKECAVNTTCWHFVQSQPIPTKVMTIGIAELQKKCMLLRDSIEICNYYYPQTYAAQPNKMDVAKDVLIFFEKTIGTYPFDKLNNVQSTTMFGGMENANNIFYDEYAVDAQQSMEALIAHEVAHQWFGNTVTEADFSQLWLSEGFATFFTNYYLEKKYGVDTLQKRLKTDSVKVANFLRSKKIPVINTTTNYMSLLNACSYEKGGLFLQALRTKLGDTVFFNGIKKYYSTYKYKNATTNDFKKVMEVISKQNLTALFKYWLY